MSTAEEQAGRPQLRAEPTRSLKDRWAERAKVRKLITQMDLSAFPDEPPLYLRKLQGFETHLLHIELLGTEENKNESEQEKALRNAKVVALCVCDETGSPVFTSDDVLALPMDLFSHVIRESFNNIGMSKIAEAEAEAEGK